MREVHERVLVNVPGPSLLSVVHALPPERISGCVRCGKTIFFNGAFWTHANDVRACDQDHKVDWENPVSTRRVQVDKQWGGWFKPGTPVYEDRPHEVKCARCGKPGYAVGGGATDIEGKGFYLDRCGVATPSSGPMGERAGGATG